MIATLALLIMTPVGSLSFWWTLVGLIALIAVHATYWIITHPVNNFWLKDTSLKGASAGFFSLGVAKKSESTVNSDDDAWKGFRDRWEYSHVLRAVLSVISLVALIIAVAL